MIKALIYTTKKTAKLATLMIAMCLLSFLLVSHSPIDPVQSYVGADSISVSAEQRDNIAAYWGLDQPKHVQFLNWATSVIHGELGTSLVYRSPVADVISDRFFMSFCLMMIAWVSSGLLGFFLGMLAGIYKGKWIDKAVKAYCFVLASTPAFWLGLILLMLFSVWLGWLPVGLGAPAGKLAEEVTIAERLQHILLPALTLSILGISNVALHTRQKLIEILNSDFIRFAIANGATPFTLLWRHGLRNVMLPFVSLHFASFGELFGGTLIVEQIFSYPGLGQAVIRAGLGGDVPLLLGIVMFSGLFVFAGNLLADLVYTWIDPRMRKAELQ